MARARVLLLVVVVALAAAACSGNASQDNAQLAKLKQQLAALQKQDQQISQQVEQAQARPAPAPDVTETTEAGQVLSDSSEVNSSFYYAEYKVTLGKTHVLTDKNNPQRGVFEIAFTCQNLTDRDGYCPSQGTIESNKKFYDGSADESGVPGKQTLESVFKFNVDDKFSLANAVLRIGDAAHHQAVIPLCPTGSSPTTVLLDPVVLPISTSVSGGGVTVTVTKAVVRADFPVHRERDKKKLTLDLTTNLDADPTWYGWLGGQSLTLVRPDGNTSAAEDWTWGGAYVQNPIHEKDQVLRFEIDNPPAGAYTLQLKGRTKDASGNVTDVAATAQFTIGGAASPATTSTTATSG